MVELSTRQNQIAPTIILYSILKQIKLYCGKNKDCPWKGNNTIRVEIQQYAKKYQICLQHETFPVLKAIHSKTIPK